MVKNLIFDFGGVILNIDHTLMAEPFARLGIPDMMERVSLSSQSSLFDDFDTGTLTPQKFREAIRAMAEQAGEGGAQLNRTPERRLSDAEIDDAWNTMLIGIPKENLELLKKARARYRIFLLSNNNVIHYNWISGYLQREFGVDSIRPYFEQAWFSQDLGMRKPNSDIFEHVLMAAGLDPGETLFMDDSPQHIATAAELGIRTRLVRKGESLREVLEPFLGGKATFKNF